MKKELDTVRSLNDTFRNQISKGEMEKKKLASEKKGIEKECKEMKSKTTSLEAQLLLYQETLEQKEELQRLCDQYLSKIQHYKKELCDNADLQCENDQYRNQINEYDGLRAQSSWFSVSATARTSARRSSPMHSGRRRMLPKRFIGKPQAASRCSSSDSGSPCHSML